SGHQHAPGDGEARTERGRPVMSDELRCLIYRRGARRGVGVALTFDDGPNPPRTEQILAILAERGAKATFFVAGKWVERFPESLRRMLAGGACRGMWRRWSRSWSRRSARSWSGRRSCAIGGG